MGDSFLLSLFALALVLQHSSAFNFPREAQAIRCSTRSTNPNIFYHHAPATTATRREKHLSFHTTGAKCYRSQRRPAAWGLCFVKRRSIALESFNGVMNDISTFYELHEFSVDAITTMLIYGASNFLAQFATPSIEKRDLDLKLLSSFMFLGLLDSAFSHFWYPYTEVILPGNSTTNVVLKLIADFVCYGGTFTFLFLFLVPVVELNFNFEGLKAGWQRVREDFWPVQLGGQLFWAPANFILYSAVAPEDRVPGSNAALLIYTLALSLWEIRSANREDVEAVEAVVAGMAKPAPAMEAAAAFAGAGGGGGEKVWATTWVEGAEGEGPRGYVERVAVSASSPPLPPPSPPLTEIVPPLLKKEEEEEELEGLEGLAEATLEVVADRLAMLELVAAEDFALPLTVEPHE